MDQIIQINSKKHAKKILEKINVSSQGIDCMAEKMLSPCLKIDEVSIGAANILKQEMLIGGGDAAVSRGIVEGKCLQTDVILMGNMRTIKRLCTRLNYHKQFDLPKLKERILNLLQIYETKISNEKTICPKILGIINVTKDSFSDGGKFYKPQAAFEHAEKLIEEGADILDIGGESTRPGAQKVDLDTEMNRVIPVIKKIRQCYKIPISIDTTKSEVAQAAIDVGANIINDISAMRFDEKMIQVLKNNPHVNIILMHMQGNPQTMQINPNYNNAIEEILFFFNKRILFCKKHGITSNRIIIDPGIGFGKRHLDNLAIIKNLDQFHVLGIPVLLGASRKSMIGRIYQSEASDRLEGSLATSAYAYQHKIQYIRVHDVKSHKRFIQTLKAIEEEV